MTDFKPYITLVENYLTSLGIDTTTCRTNNPNEWAIQKEGAIAVLAFRDVESLYKDEQGVFIVLSPMVQDPADQALSQTMVRNLMKMNHLLVSERFTLHDGWISIMTARTVDGLGAEEVEMIITSLLDMAVYFKGYIAEKYGLLEDFKPNKTDDDSSAR